MNTLPRYLFSCPTAVLLALLLWLPCRSAEAASVAQATAALDNPVGVTITKMEYWKYKLEKEDDGEQIYYWFIEDEAGNYIYTTSNGNKKWSVLSKTADTTTPAVGGSCLYSTGVEDGAAARLFLKVRGPGTLSYLVKTSCDDSDSFNAYVDDINMYDEWQSATGYGEEYTWDEMELNIDGGLAESGAYAGTPFHEIVFEYFKNEPEYDGKKKIPDGPEKDDNPDYKEELKYFKDRIWIDHVVWTPEPVDIALSPNPNPINEEEPPEEAALRGVFINERTVNIASNAKDDFGYYIRYTTDGTTPTADSPVYVVEDGILLTETCTVKAKVFDDIATGTPTAVEPEIMVSGTFQAQAAAPVLAVDLDASTHDSILCTAATTTPDAVIFYTLTPDAAPDTPWPEGGLVVTKPSQIRAIARRANTLDSDIASLEVIQAEPPTITAKANGQLLHPRAQAYTRGDTLTITITAPSGNAIYMTSTDPAWKTYTGSFPFNAGTIQTRSTSRGTLASAPVQATFQPANPDQSFTFGTPDNHDSDFALQYGWNLIGMPISPTQEAMTALRETWQAVFAVDSTTKTLCRPDWIAQGEGFWLYCDQDTQTLIINGAVLEDTDLNAAKGWRLLTPALDAEPIHDAWHWLTDEGAYHQQELAPGQGGWKYSP